MAGVGEGLDVLGDDLDVGALGGVGVGDAGLVAPVEGLEDVGLHAADEADLTGLGGHGGDIAGHEGGFLRLEGHASEVIEQVGLGVGVVDDGEVHVRVGLGGVLDRLGHGEADAPHGLGAVVDGLVQVVA